MRASNGLVTKPMTSEYTYLRSSMLVSLVLLLASISGLKWASIARSKQKGTARLLNDRRTAHPSDRPSDRTKFISVARHIRTPNKHSDRVFRHQLVDKAAPRPLVYDSGCRFRSRAPQVQASFQIYSKRSTCQVPLGTFYESFCCWDHYQAC